MSKLHDRSDQFLRDQIVQIFEDAKAEAKPYVDELTRREAMRPKGYFIEFQPGGSWSWGIKK